MNEEMQKKIVADLEKAGFRAEMQAMRTLLSRKWHCAGSSSYMDKDDRKSREIDITAHHWMKKDIGQGKNIISYFHVVAEVKKSERPWVVFGRRLPEGSGERQDAWDNLVHCEGPREWKPKLVKSLSEESLLNRTAFLGYGIHESFKGPEQPSRWYPAFLACCKAAEWTLESSTEHARDESEYASSELMSACFTFVQPVIILDGILVSAKLGESGEISVAEAKEVALRFAYNSPQYERASYRVDIVRLPNLATYLKHCELRQMQVVKTLLDLASERRARVS
jgi:hypothetical protein